MSRNSAGSYGGGANSSTLNNCTLFGNSAATSGGGAIGCNLTNCTLTGNTASSYGGGSYFGALYNCIIYYNTAPNGSNYSGGTLNYCCTMPLPAGPGNISIEPAFLDYAGGDLRLQSNSPCINAGTNFYAPAGPDLDGNPRIVGGTVDIGAYECQSPALLPFYTWLQDYGLPTHSSAVYADTDTDRMNNWQEWRCGTDPTNALSALRLLTPGTNESGLTVSWESVSGRTYFLERGTNFGVQPAFLPLATNIVGQSGTTSLTDTNAAGSRLFYYRVGIQDP